MSELVAEKDKNVIEYDGAEIQALNLKKSETKQEKETSTGCCSRKKKPVPEATGEDEEALIKVASDVKQKQLAQEESQEDDGESDISGLETPKALRRDPNKVPDSAEPRRSSKLLY